MPITLRTKGPRVTRAVRRRRDARGRRAAAPGATRILLALALGALLLAGGYLLYRRERSIEALRRGREQQVVNRLEEEREVQRIRLGYPPRDVD